MAKLGDYLIGQQQCTPTSMAPLENGRLYVSDVGFYCESPYAELSVGGLYNAFKFKNNCCTCIVFFKTPSGAFLYTGRPQFIV